MTTPDRDPALVARLLTPRQSAAVLGYGRMRPAGRYPAEVQWIGRNDVHERTERSLIAAGIVSNQNWLLAGYGLTLLGQKVWWRLVPILTMDVEVEAHAEHADRELARFERAWIDGCRKFGCYAGATHVIVSIGKGGAASSARVHTCEQHSTPDLWPFPYRVEALAPAGVPVAELVELDAPDYLTDACSNPWHRSAPARARQRCPECPVLLDQVGEQAGPTPADVASMVYRPCRIVATDGGCQRAATWRVQFAGHAPEYPSCGEHASTEHWPQAVGFVPITAAGQ